MLTSGDVARALGVTINTVKSWIRKGQLSAVRLPSGHYRISRVELERISAPPPDQARLYQQRRVQWRGVEEWEQARPPTEMPFDEALAWVESMLDFATANGPLPERSSEEKAASVTRLHRALAVLGS